MLLCPVASSPWRMSFGMRLSSVRRTWGCLSRVYMVGRPARDRTSTLVTLSCQDMPKMRRMLLTWQLFSLFSCLAYVIHVSLPYNKVLRTQALYTAIFVFTVSLVFDHTRNVRRACLVAAFPTLLSISVSRQRLIQGTWTGERNQAWSYWWWWLVVTAHLVSLHLSSSGR